MPNGTLCGKAVVEMLLAEENGTRTEITAQNLISSGDLPRAYMITQERMDRARTLDSVRMQDEQGMAGDRWGVSLGKPVRLV